MMDTDDPWNWNLIHEEAIGALQRYVDHGLPPGGFLEAVLSNDLMDACKRGDHRSLRSLVALSSYIHIKLPANIHGTREIVRLWIQLGAANRLKAPAEEIHTISNALCEALGKKHT